MEMCTAIYNEAGPSFELTKIGLFNDYREILENFAPMWIGGIAIRIPLKLTRFVWLKLYATFTKFLFLYKRLICLKMVKEDLILSVQCVVLPQWYVFLSMMSQISPSNSNSFGILVWQLNNNLTHSSTIFSMAEYWRMSGEAAVHTAYLFHG